MMICIASDLHYALPEAISIDAYGGGTVDSKATPYGEAITDAFLQQMLRTRPDALLLTGDLSLSGRRSEHEALLEKLAVLREAGIPLFVLPGNHDLRGGAASVRGAALDAAERVSPAEFARLYEDYGFGAAAARHEASLSYRAALGPALWLLAVDVNTEAAPGRLQQETLRWAEAQLRAAAEAGARVIALSHQNLLAHNRLFRDGYTVQDGEALLRLYETRGVLCNLSGHMHIQHMEESEAGFWELASSSLLTHPFQYGTLELRADGFSYHTEALRFPEEAAARRYIWEGAYRQALRDLGEAGAARFFADVNEAYFAGCGEEMPQSGALWDALCAGEGFLNRYLRSIRDDAFRDHRTYEKTGL